MEKWMQAAGYEKLRMNSIGIITFFHVFSLVFIEIELDKLKFQTSDDMNDCVKYISTINDKLNQVALVSENQHSFTE